MDKDSFATLLTTPSFTGFHLATACLATFAFALSLFYAVFWVSSAPSEANSKKSRMTDAFRTTGNIGNHDYDDDDEDWGDEDDDDEDDEEDEKEDDEDDDDEDEGDKNEVAKPKLSVTAGPGEWKMVLCIRTDLDMGKGKAAAQCCHATLAAVRKIEKTDPKGMNKWERYGQAKVTLKCPNEDSMVELQKKARSLGLVAESIRDAGRTQIAANSRTVLAIGPGPKKLIDDVTGHLKLY